ncbi:MAG: DUF4157 domain-containing protein [Burkholderiales bacterium]
MSARSLLRAPAPSSAPRARGLALGALDGPLEADADRAAGAVNAGRSASLAAGSSSASTSRDEVAPASVDRVVSGGGGAPLPGRLRSDMEHRFGQDFGSVRLHADTAASNSARDIGAAAYSVGAQVVMGAGRYAPQTSSGRALIAHELAHVVQQRGVAQPVVMRKPDGGTMRPASAADKRDLAGEAIKFVKGQADYFALKREKDRNLATELKQLKEVAEPALTAIAGDKAAAQLTLDLQSAYTAAVRASLLAGTKPKKGAIKTPPTLHELYEEHIDEILPFALPKASSDSGATELVDELAQPLPAGATAAQRTRQTAIDNARANLQVVTASIDVPLEDLFGGKTKLGLPANTVVRFASTVPAKLQGGLNLVAATLVNNGSKASLKPNSSAMLALELTPYGGGYDAYRFTRLDLGSAGTEVLVERQGAIGVEGLHAEQRKGMQARFDRVGFVRGSGFRGDDFDQVLIGLGEIPEAQLQTLSGLRFERKAASPTQKEAAADYDQARHAVEVFDKAFNDGSTRLGRSGRVIKVTAHAISHEVGHAFDLAPLRSTAAASDKADKALMKEFGQADGGYTIPGRGSPDRARFDAVNGPMTAAHQAEKDARSGSGARWSSGDPATVVDAFAAGPRQPAFRAAVLADGNGKTRMPTDYPNPESIWQEFFADAYSMFQNSPDLLRTMRPRVFAFMVKEFPK